MTPVPRSLLHGPRPARRGHGRSYRYHRLYSYQTGPDETYGWDWLRDWRPQ